MPSNIFFISQSLIQSVSSNNFAILRFTVLVFSFVNLSMRWFSVSEAYHSFENYGLVHEVILCLRSISLVWKLCPWLNLFFFRSPSPPHTHAMFVFQIFTVNFSIKDYVRDQFWTFFQKCEQNVAKKCSYALESRFECILSNCWCLMGCLVLKPSRKLPNKWQQLLKTELNFEMISTFMTNFPDTHNVKCFFTIPTALQVSFENFLLNWWNCEWHYEFFAGIIQTLDLIDLGTEMMWSLWFQNVNWVTYLHFSSIQKSDFDWSWSLFLYFLQLRIVILWFLIWKLLRRYTANIKKNH